MKRGRRSGADLTTVPAVVALPRRPEPPPTLSADAAKVWRETTADRPADWFDRASLPLLKAYARHVAAVATISAQVDAIDPAELADIKRLARYDRLLRMRIREGVAVARLSRLLRLNVLVRKRGDKAAREVEDAPRGPRPWE